MARRPLSCCVMLAAATLAVASIGGAARAQDADVGLRGGAAGGADSGGTGLGGTDSGGASIGQPDAPQDQPLSTPQRVTPPASNASAADADDQAPTSLAPQNKSEDTGPNYGKPRKRKAKLFKSKTKGAVPLSPLVPYRGSPGTKKELNPKPPPKDAIDPVQPGPTVAVLQSPLRYRRPINDADPFKPVGVRAGELILRPYVETSAGYDTNPNQVQAGIKPSPALRGEGGVDVDSDFSSSKLTATIRGGYTEFPANTVASRPDLDAVVDGLIDVTRQDTIETELRALVQTITPGTPLLAIPNAVYITNRPLISSEGATLGGTHLFGRLSLGLRGTFDRTQYGDASQSNGTVYRFSQDNYNDYGIVARASYELSPAIKPFAEVGGDVRVRDNAIDLSGFYRDSTGISGKAGLIVDLFGYLSGTVDGGYLQRHYDDRRLPLLAGPVVDGQLVYRASYLTTVTLRASTFASETTLPFASGAISRSVGLEASHVFFQRFTLTGIALLQPDEYQGVKGHDLYSTYTVKGLYALTREVALTATASRQAIRSTFAGQSFVDYNFLLGVRLQR